MKKIFVLLTMALFIIFMVNPRRAKADDCPSLDSVHKEVIAIAGSQYKKEIDWFLNGWKYAEEHPGDDAILYRESQTKEELCHQRRLFRQVVLEDPFSMILEIRKLMVVFPIDYKTFAIENWNAKEK